WDVDGHEYVDYHFGSGALLLGHAHPEVMAAIQDAVSRGWHYAQPHPLEAEWGEKIQELVPSAERLRFVNSGTEADLLATRLARARRPWSAADRLRGDHRPSLVGRWCPGAVRYQTGPDRDGQDRLRWDAGRRGRRAGRDHGAARWPDSGLPRRHLQR